MNAPEYTYPSGVIAALIRDILFLRRRDFHLDAQACIARLTPHLSVLGAEHVPSHGPCVVTVNHYHRPGFGAEWLALAISARVPARVHWIMTGEFMYEGKWYQPAGSRLSRILLKRLAHVYGFTTMPPLPPREKDVSERAASVRAVLQFVKRAGNPILGLAPEGHDARDDGVLTRPVRGVGRFGLLLAKAGLKFVPVGAFEADGRFHIHFGGPYTLRVPAELSPDEKDRSAAQIMMENIAGLMPPQLRGEFA